MDAPLQRAPPDPHWANSRGRTEVSDGFASTYQTIRCALATLFGKLYQTKTYWASKAKGMLPVQYDCGNPSLRSKMGQRLRPGRGGAG
jgi:hypothetical protein